MPNEEQLTALVRSINSECDSHPLAGNYFYKVTGESHRLLGARLHGGTDFQVWIAPEGRNKWIDADPTKIERRF